jgi:hypothetical protein
LPNRVVAPFSTADGRVAVASLPMDGSLKLVPVRMPGSSACDDMLAAPVIGVGGLVFWVGETGFLSFELGRGMSDAAWRSWPEGFSAKPWLRPFRAPNGALWAFGLSMEDSAAGRAAVCELTATDGNRDLRLLDGPHASAGGATFRGRARHRWPWAEPEETVQVGLDLGDRWLLPIVSFPDGQTVVAAIEDSASMRSFLFREGRASPRLANLFLHRPNGGLTSMHHALELASTDDLDVFASEGRLCLYHRDTNECVSWPLV